MDPVVARFAPARTTPKAVFFYLGWFITLWMVVSNFVGLLFSYINILLPEDDVWYIDPSLSVRWEVAVLTVIFPVFMALSWLIQKDISTNPNNLHLGIRKWMVSLAIFVMASIAVGDLMFLFYGFLNGDLATRFVLKSLTLLAVMAGALAYYFYDLKGWLTNTNKPKLTAWAVSLVMLVSVVIGIVVSRT